MERPRIPTDAPQFEFGILSFRANAEPGTGLRDAGIASE